MKKRVVAMMLSAMMAVSLTNVTAYAADGNVVVETNADSDITETSDTEPAEEDTNNQSSDITVENDANSDDTNLTNGETEKDSAENAADVTPSEETKDAGEIVEPAAETEALQQMQNVDATAVMAVAVEDEDADDEENVVCKIGDTGYESIDDAIAAAQDGDTIKIVKSGEYTTYGNISRCKEPGAAKLSLTIEAAEGVEVTWYIGEKNQTTDRGGENNGDYSFDGYEAVKFKNINMKLGSTLDYHGFIRINNLTFEDCTIDGKMYYSGYVTSTFKNCTFNITGNQYPIAAITAVDSTTFDGCTFNTELGKFVNVYMHNTAITAGKTVEIIYKDCTANVSAEKGKKSVLNIKEVGDYGANKASFDIQISGTNTVSTAVNADKNTCSRLFMVDHWDDGKESSYSTTYPATISINGTKVWGADKMVSHALNCGSVKYSDGYADEAYKINSDTTVENEDGSKDRTVTATCDYCGAEFTFTEHTDAPAPEPQPEPVDPEPTPEPTPELTHTPDTTPSQDTTPSGNTSGGSSSGSSSSSSSSSSVTIAAAATPLAGPTEAETVTITEEETPQAAPKTGQTNDLLFYELLLGASALAGGLALRGAKKNEDK